MNWPGVCNINSSLNVRASLFFVFFYTSCSHLQCHATRHSIHLVSPFCFVLFCFSPCEAPRRVTCTFFFFTVIVSRDLCSGNRLGVCGFGRASAVTRACRGLTWWVAFLTPTALARLLLFVLRAFWTRRG